MSVKPQELAQSSIDSAVLLANTTLDSVERARRPQPERRPFLVETSFANVNALLGAKDVQSSSLCNRAWPFLPSKGSDYSSVTPSLSKRRTRSPRKSKLKSPKPMPR